MDNLTIKRKATELLCNLEEMIRLLQQDESTYYKQAILRKYPQLKRILYYIYNPLINFYVTGDTVLNREDLYEEIDSEIISLEELLIKLSTRKVTRDEAIMLCRIFLHTHGIYTSTIIKILNRDLRCGISAKTINKVWSGLIPEFNVPLANNYKGQVDITDGTWYVSRKLDGIRCLVFIEKEDIRFYSRKGKEFFTLDKISDELFKYWTGPKDIILDGEICIFKDNVEDFKAISSEIRRKQHTIENPLFYVFDVYPIDHFKRGYTTMDYATTLFTYEKYFNNLSKIRLLNQKLVKEDYDIVNISSEWEGLMLRNKGATQFKRSNNLLKVKKFMDDEYIVQDIQIGHMRIDGAETKCCTGLIINHKGNSVGVGSGLTNEQRINWFNNPDLIKGKEVTIKYFSESKDKKGNISLRFPVLKSVNYGN